MYEPQVQALQPQASAGIAAHQLPLRAAFAQVVHAEGFLSLWKGNAVTILHRLPYSAVNFWTYERTNELWHQLIPATPGSEQMPMDMLRRLTSGAVAGSVACAGVSKFCLHLEGLVQLSKQCSFSGRPIDIEPASSCTSSIFRLPDTRSMKPYLHASWSRWNLSICA